MNNKKIPIEFIKEDQINLESFSESLNEMSTAIENKERKIEDRLKKSPIFNQYIQNLDICKKYSIDLNYNPIFKLFSSFIDELNFSIKPEVGFSELIPNDILKLLKITVEPDKSGNRELDEFDFSFNPSCFKNPEEIEEFNIIASEVVKSFNIAQ